MASFFFEWIKMAVHLLLPTIREKLLELASSAAQWILEPSSRRAICAQPGPATTKAVPPPHDNNCSTIVDHVATLSNVSSDDVKENNISSSSTTTPERSGSWDIIRTASYDDDLHWRTIEDKTLQDDIEPLAHLANTIIHSGKYRNGDRLSKKDEKDVMENLLKYHYGFEKKIGSGFSYIMVDMHVEFEDSRCMYVVRTDGSRMDFSYRKCLRGYVEHKYPAHAEKFDRWNLHLVKVKTEVAVL